MIDFTLIRGAVHGLVSSVFTRSAARAALVAAGALGAFPCSGVALAPGTAGSISAPGAATVPAGVTPAGRSPESRPRNDGGQHAKAPIVARVTKCTPPTRESITAESVLKDMRDGKDVELRGRVIEGSLEADLLWPPGDNRMVSLRVIAGKVHLESCKVTGRFDFPRSVFVQGLDLPCTEIRGDLDLSNTRVQGALNAAHLRLLGALRAPRLDVSGDVSFAEGSFGERIDLTSVRIDGAVDFTRAEMTRDIELSSSIIGGIDLSFARVAGLTKLDDVLVLGEVTAHDARFGRGLQIDSVRTVGSLDLDGACGAGDVTLRSCVLGRDLLLAVASQGPVVVSDVTVGRELSLMDGRFAALTIARVRVAGGSELEGVRVAGAFSMIDSDFGETFGAADALFEGISEFTKVRFPGEDPMAGAIFRHAPLLVDTALPHPPTVESAQTSPEEDSDDDQGDVPPD